MKDHTKLALLVWIFLVSSLFVVPQSPVYAQSDCDPDGIQASGAVYRICMPSDGLWNGDLVIYAHGYVSPDQPIRIPEEQLKIGGRVSIPALVNGLGFAFATTSYSANGLAVRQGISDILDLVQIFRMTYGEPGHTYLVGASEGGLITALLIEQHPEVFSGGLSACGPIGDFREQIDYWGDIRVLFDYFFPGLIPGDAISIPQQVMEQWDTSYEPLIRGALWAKPARTRQIIEAAGVPRHPVSRDRNVEALVDALWYNIFSTNDGIVKLGGQPFDNSQRIYRDSANDRRLNRGVDRFQADPGALQEIEAHYQTSGALQIPLITLHTLGDPIVPYWHQMLYRRKVMATGNEAFHTNLPILSRYGHCNFSAPQVLLGFALLVRQASGQIIPNTERVLSSPQERKEYEELASPYGLEVTATRP